MFLTKARSVSIPEVAARHFVEYGQYLEDLLSASGYDGKGAYLEDLSGHTAGVAVLGALGQGLDA